MKTNTELNSNKYLGICGYKNVLQVINSTPTNFSLTADEIKSAEKMVIRILQKGEFSKEITELKKEPMVNHTSKLAALKPFIGNDQVLRVGGRLPMQLE